MTERISLGGGKRDRRLMAVEKQLLDFERKEREFRKEDRQERAEELRLPLHKASDDRQRGSQPE
jgi:hypothetical protein